MASQRLPPSLPSRTMSGRYFYGWNVVAATFVMALFSFGLGFYGLSVYVATLQRIHGWSASGGVRTGDRVLRRGRTTDDGDRRRIRAIRAARRRLRRQRRDGGRRRGTRQRHAAVAALPDIPRHVARLGRDERRRREHHSRAVVRATARPRRQRRIQRRDARRRHPHARAVSGGSRRRSGGQVLGRGAEFREGAFRQHGLYPV